MVNGKAPLRHDLFQIALLISLHFSEMVVCRSEGMATEGDSLLNIKPDQLQEIGNIMLVAGSRKKAGAIRALLNDHRYRIRFLPLKSSKLSSGSGLWPSISISTEMHRCRTPIALVKLVRSRRRHRSSDRTDSDEAGGGGVVWASWKPLFTESTWSPWA